ncbi:MAG: putative molybdenum carrier protein [Magnetococcales bacterium]|nr:putative molybdenum carrier protein [Magnetococcales bacterium]
MIEIFLKKVVSGGQTGVDRAALDFANRCGLPSGGWCPKGRRAIDGPIPEQYSNMKETPSASYSQRTEWNIRDSDGTLIISRGVLNGGTALTNRLAKTMGKPCLILDMDYVDIKKEAACNMLNSWIMQNSIHILNVAGPRERDNAGIYKEALNFLVEFWKDTRCRF